MPITSQNPVITYTANGSVTTFSFPFRVIKQSDLHVYQNGVESVGGFTVSGIDNPAGGSITFTVAPINGTLVRLQRTTSVDRSTDYVEGGQLAASTLDNDFDRVVMMMQDVNQTAMVEVSDGTFDAESKRIKNVANPVNAQDAVTKSYHDSTYIPQINTILTSATTQATNAANSATASANSATAAANSATASANSATQSATSATASASSATSAANSLAALSQFTGTAIGGNLSFTGTGQRIVGDFSNATGANRVMFQTSTLNGATAVGVIPNGTSQLGQVQVFSSSDPANSSYMSLNADSASGAIALVSNKLGTASFLPITMIAGGAERVRINTNGALQVGTGSSLAIGTSDPLNLVSSGAADLRQRWYQAGVQEWSLGMASGSGTFSLRTGPAGGTERLGVWANGDTTVRAGGSANVTHTFTFNENGGEISLHDSAGSPYSLLDAAPTNGSTRMLHVGATGDLLVGHGATGTGIIKFMRAGYLEAMRIAADGKVAVGGTPYSGVTSFTTYGGRAAIIANNEPYALQIQYGSGGNGQFYIGATNSAAPDLLFSNVGGQEMVRISNGGNLTVSTPALLGYGTGAGGTVTQATSKSTAVTLNKPCGQITMNNAALAAGGIASFTVNNSLVALGDTVAVTLRAGYATVGTYRVAAEAVNTGTFYISLENRSAGSLSEAVVINFTVIKGATA